MTKGRTELYRRAIHSPLMEYSRNVTSQCGEDGIIERMVEVICPAERYCIEFGAWDGKRFSNCYNLLANAGWDGLMIEADPTKFRELQATFTGHPGVTMFNRFVDIEGENRLDRILEDAGAPPEPGLLSIDIDGNDYYVFESLEKFRPEVIIVEFNPTVPNDVLFVQERSFEVNHGSSLLALVLLAKEKGYELAVATGWNGFFVRNDKYPLLGIEDNVISTLYAPLQDGRIFQGYDSSIHVVGMNQLVWRRNRPLTSADFQVVPEAERTWSDAQKKR